MSDRAVRVDRADFERRVLEPDDFVADDTPFVDVRIPGSIGKESYSFIGPGVVQGYDIQARISEPHGFNVGAAMLPPGTVNNPHLHFTAEVFIVTEGHLTFTIGLGDDAASVEAEPGDVLSVPTWVFRSFRNTGDQPAWAFTCLGRNETGGIIWAPEVLAAGADTGLALDRTNHLIELGGNGHRPDDLIHPLGELDLAELQQPTGDELERCVVRHHQLDWRSRALLPAGLPGHRIELAPVLGIGLNAERAAAASAPIDGRGLGVSIEWLAIEPGSETGPHRVDVSQVAYLVSGRFEIEHNQGGERISARPDRGSVVSLTPGSWRSIRNVGHERATAVLATEGEGRAPVTWADEIVERATADNRAVDANGCLAPAHILAGGPRP